MIDRQERMMYEIEKETNQELEKAPTFLERAEALDNLTVTFIQESIPGIHQMTQEELQKLMYIVMRTGDYAASDDIYKLMHDYDKIIWEEIERRKL